ncbi:ATP-binding cassette domain-containing protein [Microbulbifer epialgicus]|uniref:ATP-binding cassette domain-containing protein n=1 Tax=Microbulbifer epialgicus TaxID=393907 RepID=A0ABV4NUU9_9GAMM
MPAICTLENFSLAIGDTLLFNRINSELPTGITGLVAPNGWGKSTLLKALSGQTITETGRIIWSKPHFLVKQFQDIENLRVADCLKHGELYSVFYRIEQGLSAEEDLVAVADNWHLPATWKRQLKSADIQASLDTPINKLSGGQRARLTLSTAFAYPDHYLLLDESNNCLDREGREWLKNRLIQHPGGALIASHDRQLLENVNQILEINQQKLRLYGSGYSDYQHQRNAEQAVLSQRIEANRKELKKLNELKQQTLHKTTMRQHQGERRRSSQSKSLVDAQKDRAGQNLGRIKRELDRRQSQLENTQKHFQELSKKRNQKLTPQKLNIIPGFLHGTIRLHLENLCLPFGKHRAPISMTLHSGDRWHVTGGNGYGKSTLLKIIAGQLEAQAGVCQRFGSYCYLDQDLSIFNKDLSALDNLIQRFPGSRELEWRTAMGSMRLRGDMALRPIRLLSGGERLKVALLAATHGNPAADLLLLDEPENHLDLDSRQLLERALRDFPGTFLIASHDPAFIEAIGVNGQLKLE